MNKILQPSGMLKVSAQHDGPTMAQTAGALTVLMVASVAFVVMFLWPVVARFV